MAYNFVSNQIKKLHPVSASSTRYPNGKLSLLKYHSSCQNLFVAAKYKGIVGPSKISKSSTRGTWDISRILPSKYMFIDDDKFFKKIDLKKKNKLSYASSNFRWTCCKETCYYTSICYRKENEKNLTEQKQALNSTFESVENYPILMNLTWNGKWWSFLW